MMMTRGEFLRSIVGVGVGAVGVAAIASCGDDGGNVTIDSPPGIDAAPKNCLANGTAVVIGGNHGHTMTVPAADITAGAEKVYQIMGTSLHPHTVTITAAMFTMLRNNTSVTVQSSVDSAHGHSVIVNCA